MLQRRLIAVVVGLATALGSAWPVTAAPFSDEYATAFRVESQVIYDGVAGSASIRTDPATVNGVTYVHPVFMHVGPVGGDFVSIGTANGAATSGPNGTCPAQMNAKWDLYVDAWLGGMYWGCVTILANAYAAGTTQSFRISWSFCDSAQACRWVLYWSGVQRWCFNHVVHAGQKLEIGLEVVSTPENFTDRNIDVKYSGLTLNLINQSTWFNWITLPPGSFVVSPNYTVTNPTATTVNSFLAPLE